MAARAAQYSYICQPVDYSDDPNEVRVSMLEPGKLKDILKKKTYMHDPPEYIVLCKYINTASTILHVITKQPWTSVYFITIFRE